jgi:vacuolar-type H+-ATPase subunit E/Vma4
VEAQQAEASESSQKNRVKLSARDAEIARQKQGLQLARHRVLQQLEVSTNPRHRQLLQGALADLDEKLRQLGN